MNFLHENILPSFGLYVVAFVAVALWWLPLEPRTEIVLRLFRALCDHEDHWVWGDTDYSLVCECCGYEEWLG